MKLRFQYIVRHPNREMTYGLGETCLESYTGLSSEVVRDIKKGFHNINLERDEILIRLRDNYYTNPAWYKGIELPDVFQIQKELNLPFSEKQEQVIAKLVAEGNKHEKLKREAKLLQNLQDLIRQKHSHLITNVEKPLEYVERLTNEDREQVFEGLLSNVTPKSYSHLFEGVKVTEDIQLHLEWELPLLKRQVLLLHQLHKSVIDDRKRTDQVMYKDIIDRHLPTLKAIRQKEAQIPQGLWNDWREIEKDVKELKKGGNIDYSTWKLRVSNLIIPLRIQRDVFL